MSRDELHEYALQDQGAAPDRQYARGSSPAPAGSWLERYPDQQFHADAIWRSVQRGVKDLIFEALREQYDRKYNHLIFGLNDTPAESFSRIKQAPEEKTLRLQFSESNTPVFYSEDFYAEDPVTNEDGSPILVELVDIKTGKLVEEGAESSVDFRIVVLEGDFESDNDRGNWPPFRLQTSIVKHRDGKKKLLGGDLTVTLTGGKGNLSDDLHFTDNSSWNRSKMFRLALQLVPSCSFDGLHIQEAITKPFKVKDKRGKLNMKRKAPSIEDEVWVLANIGDGLCKRLNKNSIYKVKHFLQSYETDPEKLRHVLKKMSHKQFQTTLEHAMKSRAQLGGAPVPSTSTIHGPDQELCASKMVVSVTETEASWEAPVIKSKTRQEHEQDPFLKELDAAPACGTDHMQLWELPADQSGSSYVSQGSNPNLAAPADAEYNVADHNTFPATGYW